MIEEEVGYLYLKPTRQQIVDALIEGRSVRAAAVILRTSKSTLYRWMKRHDVRVAR